MHTGRSRSFNTQINSSAIDGFSKATGLNKGIGIKQSNYQADEYERSSPVKMEQREKVLQFILDNHDPSLSPRYFGMPGKYWLFERMLFNESKNPHICGIEKNYRIFGNACGYMPGNGFRRRNIYPWAIDHRLEGQHCKKISSQALEIAETKNAYYMCGDLQSITSDKCVEKSRERGPYKRILKTRTAIWYDFTSALDINTYTCIWQIKNIINQNYRSVICLTLQYGRDTIFNGKGESGRVRIVETALPDFVCTDVWAYKGFNNTPMITICGINAIPLPQREGTAG